MAADAAKQVVGRPQRGAGHEGKACSILAAQACGSPVTRGSQSCADVALLCSMLGHLPPVQLHVLHGSMEPNCSSSCQDKACLIPATCPGISFIWVDAFERSKLEVQQEHYKSARL